MTRPTTAQTNPLIRINDLHFAYPTYSDTSTEIWALNGLNLELPQGAISAIMGPTGSGKSTLAQALLGIVPQSTGGRIRGTIEVCGMDPVHTPVADMARQVGLVFQDPEVQFLTDSVLEEVAFGLESLGIAQSKMDGRIEAALSQTGISHLFDRSPYQLSGGQKQRVAIASILAMQPQLLVLDEPASSLDEQGAKELTDTIRGLRDHGHTSTILITNQAEWVLEFADIVAVLHQGKLWQQGPPAQVFQSVAELESIGIKPPDLKRLEYHIGAISGQTIKFTSWDQAQAELVDLLSGIL